MTPPLLLTRRINLGARAVGQAQRPPRLYALKARRYPFQHVFVKKTALVRSSRAFHELIVAFKLSHMRANYRTKLSIIKENEFCASSFSTR